MKGVEELVECNNNNNKHQISGRKNSMCKGPRARRALEFLRNVWKVRIGVTEDGKRRKSGERWA